MADNPLDVYLAEYNSLRQEQLNRMQIQFSAITWLLTLIAAVITAVTFLYEKAQIHDPSRLISDLLPLVPIATSPIAFITFDHTVMIHRIGSHIATTLRPCIVRHLEATKRPCEGIVAWGSITGAPRTTVHCIKYLFFPLGTWLFFVLLIPVPTLLSSFVAEHWTHAGWRALAMVLDWVLTLAFAYASLAVWNERALWLGKGSSG